MLKNLKDYSKNTRKGSGRLEKTNYYYDFFTGNNKPFR